MRLSLFVPLAVTALILCFQNCGGANSIDPKDATSSGSSVSGPNPSPAPAPPTNNCSVNLTSGSSWTVPSDWNSSNNTIEAYGNGSDAGGNVRGGGGGGAYSKSVNVALTPGSTVAYSVAHAGIVLEAGNDSGDAYFCNSTNDCASATDTNVVVSAKGGSGSTNGSNLDSLGGAGGQASGGVATGSGAVKYSGGKGGDCTNAICNTGTAPGTGGGAAGPTGNGTDGANGGAGGGGLAGAGGGPNVNGGNYGGGGGGGTDGTPAGGIGGGGIIVLKWLGNTCR